MNEPRFVEQLHYETRPCTAVDYAELLRTADPLRSLGTLDPHRVFAALCDSGMATAGTRDGEILAAGGVAVRWPGLGYAWALVSPLGRRYPTYVHRTIYWGLRDFAVLLKLRRVECEAHADFLDGHAWLERLGFEFESTMPRYGPHGETFWKYRYFPEIPA